MILRAYPCSSVLRVTVNEGKLWCLIASSTRCRAVSRYVLSTSIPMLFLPVAAAAMVVLPVPRKGSRTVSPAKEKSLISRSARAVGKGDGWPRSLDSPLMSVQAERSHACISFFVSIERVFCRTVGER